MKDELQAVMAEIETHEEVDIKDILVPIQEVTISQDDQFDKIVKYLNWVSHEIDDIGAVAARLINERRAKYNFHFEQNKTFLREYAIEHLKRDKDGQIKGKNYKSLTAGGGVFFRAKPEKISISQDNLWRLMTIFLEAGYSKEAVDGIIKQKIAYEVPDQKALIRDTKILIETRANEMLGELKQTVEMTEEQAKEALDGFIRQGESEIFGVGGIIEIDEADAFHSMSVGATKGWSGKSTKVELNKAIDGRVVYEDEVEALIEELE